MNDREKVLWLFDLGNTSLKGRWSRDGEPGQALGIDWDTLEPDDLLREMLDAWPEPGCVLVASVASDQRARLLRRALQRWPRVSTEWLSSPRQACGITNGYRIPERLGIDRFLAMIGARAASGGAPCVVVGCGTALTLDAVDAQGRQREGLIAPSPDLMVRSLHGGTAIGETNPDAFESDLESGIDDTRKAIRAGCWRAATALVDAFHAGYRAEFDAPALWLHGGGAASLKAALDQYGSAPARLLDDAVWRGLEVWAASQPGAGARP
ncbi:MAG: type III pantothenate kinase [Rhodanobacteraceae bacterium]